MKEWGLQEKKRRLGPRYEDILTCVGGGCKLMLSFFECLAPNELWNTASEHTSIKTNYGCCLLIEKAEDGDQCEQSTMHTHTQSRTPVSLTSSSNEVMQLCSLTYDLLKRPPSPWRYLLKSESQQSTFSPSEKQESVRPCTCVCVIYLTVQLGLPTVSASKHSHGNQTQPNPFRCPGMCV